MPSRKRPNELRALNWTVLGLPCLLFALMLKLVEGPACSFMRLIEVDCMWAIEVPDVLYDILFAVAAGCLLLTVYRAYRDFWKGDFEVDLAIRSASRGDGRKEAMTETARRQVATTPSIPVAGKEWADEIGRELEAMLDEQEPDRVQAVRLT